MVCSKADLQQQEKTVVLHTAEALCFIAQQHNVTGRNTLVVNFQLTFAKKTICDKRGVTHDLPFLVLFYRDVRKSEIWFGFGF